MGQRSRNDKHDEKLTIEELGQLTRDIVMGRRTEVVLDNPTTRRTFISLRTDIERAKKYGRTIESPE